jgi:choline dehydrogenase-like flavoprotein
MLSGVGARQKLEPLGIEVQIHLPGVGMNLQDRYEVSVVNRMKDDWEVLTGARFAKGDRQYEQWASGGKGVYATNGGVLMVVKKSQSERKLPDVFLLGLVGRFEGYFPEYSEWIRQYRDYLSWVVLKAHTVNTAGTVTLRSTDPRDMPHVNFHYFEEGSDKAGEDLEAVVEGVRFVRKMTADLKKQGLIVEETLPGEEYQTNEQLRDFVRDNAWGHHASCTCKIGPKNDPMAVLDSNFQVYGTKGLRVVDASVFPRIPGFFIVSAVYMIAEKAADVILADAKR